MEEISPSELSARLDDDHGGPLVLDVRSPADFARWHVPGSVNLDIRDELSDGLESAKTALSRLPENSEVVVACTAGEVAVLAAEYLRELGYDVKLLACHYP